MKGFATYRDPEPALINGGGGKTCVSKTSLQDNEDLHSCEVAVQKESGSGGACPAAGGGHFVWTNISGVQNCSCCLQDPTADPA